MSPFTFVLVLIALGILVGLLAGYLEYRETEQARRRSVELYERRQQIPGDYRPDQHN